MRVRARCDYFGAEGRVTGGQVLEISEARFRQLTEGPYLRNPLVFALDVGYKMQPPLQNKMEPPPANKEAGPSTPSPADWVSMRGGIDHRGQRPLKEAAKEGAADPTASPPAGGPTGAVNAASLSELDPPRVKRKYTRRAVALE